MNLKIFCDGGARGNPGPAAWAFVVYDEQNKIVAQKNEKMGTATNNVVEYTAAIKALEWLTNFRKQHAEHKIEQVNFFLDSKLVVSQLNGFYKVKNQHLRELVIKVRVNEQLAGGSIFYHFIPREKNFLADDLVNRALDAF